MAIDIIITTDRIHRDPKGRELIDYLRNEAQRLEIVDSVLYYDFPTYADYDTVRHKPDALLVSARHGIIAIKFADPAEIIPQLDESLGQFCSILIGRLLKTRLLRSGRSRLQFEVTPVLFLPSGVATEGLESETATAFENLRGILSAQRLPALISREVFAEMRSVIEGAKALTRPSARTIDDASRLPLAAAVAALEAEIANFDQQQRRAALVTIRGPQRIRGLAGSGKTVILAMKAAHLHLTRPDDNILFTFYTQSLRRTITGLITRFFRHYRDEDPNWERVHVRHGWGGRKVAGVYADACLRADRVPLTYGSAKARAGSENAFDYACRDFLKTATIEPFYDHTLIDEGQDFPTAFYELCFSLTKGERDQKSLIWAYDELQNIINVRIRRPEELFGSDEHGAPRVSLDRAATGLPPGATNDVVLSRCYRNQREVLLVAHALGFGIYGEIVQLLEDREHWQDVGYEVEEGDFKVGETIRIVRPQENSPTELRTPLATPLIGTYGAKDAADEARWTAEQIKAFIDGGLQPEDIMVVSLDDRNARFYFGLISDSLAKFGISSNNIIAPYTEPPFTLSGHVTLSPVYRAKGNESAVVCAIGIDAVNTRTRSGRNKLFTAFTRAKGWLRVSGLAEGAKGLLREIEVARTNVPHLVFRMPDLQQVELIQRDLTEKAKKLTKIRKELEKRLREEGFGDDEIAEIANGLAVEAKDGTQRRSKRNS